MTMDSLLVVGSLAYDDIETATLSGKSLLGGSVTHFSAAAALTGARPRILAVVGEDFDEADLDRLRALPADLDGVERRSGRSFRWGGRYAPDFSSRETLFTELGVFADWRPQLDAEQSRSEILFLANIHPTLQAEVLRAASGARFTALDTMNLWIDQTPEELASVMGNIDLLFINDEEARQLTGERSLIRAGERLLSLGPAHCLLKKGEHGALLFSGGAIFPFPSFPVHAVVDPTGAGDAFAGGVMGQLSTEGHWDTPALRRALVTGTVTGSFAVEGLGVDGLMGRDKEELRTRRNDLMNLLKTPENAF